MQAHIWMAIGQVQEASGLNTRWQCTSCGAKRTEEPGKYPPEYGDSGCQAGFHGAYEKRLREAGIEDNGQFINYDGGLTIQLDGHFCLRELELLCEAWREIGGGS
jgi:hypothetical protein